MNISTQISPPVYPDDEIDLFELAQEIWREKVLVMVITAVVTGLALGYALFATPVYQTSSVLKPAQIKDLDELNSFDIYSLPPSEALQQVGVALESYEVRFDFFKNNQRLFEPVLRENVTLEQNFERFNENLKMLKPNPDPKRETSLTSYVGLQLEYSQKLNGPAIVNGFVQHAIDEQRARLAEDLQVIIANRLEKINRDLEELRSGYQTEKEIKIIELTEEDSLKRNQLQDELEAIRFALKSKRENRIKTLDEAIVIAQSLGIHKPTTLSGLNDINTEGQQIPTYLMGTEALEAEKSTLLARKNDDFTSARIVEIQQELKQLEHNREIEILRARKNEDLFLAELADKQREISRLNGIKLNMDSLKLVTLDQPATQPTRAIKPKKTLIVAIGVMLGGMLGLFAALIRSAIRKRIQA